MELANGFIDDWVLMVIPPDIDMERDEGFEAAPTANDR